MLQPKKRKFRKNFRGSRGGVAVKGSSVVFGEYGIKSLEPAWLSSKELEAARKKITFVTKRAGKYWIRVFPHKPITKKPVGVKMGAGKGDIDEYVAVVKRGTVLFEIGGVSEEVARSAMNKASHKLSVDTAFVAKRT